MKKFLLGALLTLGASLACAQSTYTTMYPPVGGAFKNQTVQIGNTGNSYNAMLGSQQVDDRDVTALLADGWTYIDPLNIGISIQASGALCNGVADDAAAINSFLAKFAQGTKVIVPAGKQCLINSANLSVPANVQIVGTSSPFNATQSLTGCSGFLVNASYTINLSNGSQLENLCVFASGMISGPSASQAISAVAAWGSSRSIGVTIPINIGGVNLRNLVIEGFNTCIQVNSGDFSIQRVMGDCYNGFEGLQGGDNFYVDDVRFEPFYSLGTSAASGSWARPGIAFNAHDGNTGGAFTRIFSFMWANGFVQNNIGVNVVSNSGFEWQSSLGNGITGTVGMRWINHNSQTQVNNTYCNGFDSPFSFEGIGEVMAYGPSANGTTTSAFYLGGTQSATNIGVTLGGTVSVGNTASITLTSVSITGSPLTVTYTAVFGDTLASVASGLEKLVDANQALIAAKIVATASSNVVTVVWPYATTASGTAASTGNITTAINTSAPFAGGGSYGVIDGADVNIGTSYPAFSTYKNINHWTIANPYISNSGKGVYSGWLQSNDSSTEFELTLSGIPWAATVNNSGLTNCGTSPSLDIYGTDLAGTLTEGTTATGCTFTFYAPFYKPPYCTISSPNGAAITSYSVTTTAITIVNPSASGNKYTWNCGI